MTATDHASQSEVVAFLGSPAAYGLKPGETVERAETHGAIVFLAGEYAYKLKRAVKYPYLDYSTVALRRAACRTELAVNHRMAPALYLGVKGIVRDAGGGLRLADEGEAGDAALDWVVVMRRFAQSDLFEQLRQAGRLTPELMRDLAEVIAAFHGAAEPSRDFGGARAMEGIVAGNLRVIESMPSEIFGRTRVDALARLSWEALERLGPLLDRRRDKGLVRRCHGDLHLNNICLFEGRPMLFDAIEFEESFATIDVLYDLSFLLMDLDRHGLRPFANIVLNRYLEHSLDYAGLAALPLFLSCRAAIRAHVTVTRAEALHTREGLDEARELLDQAIAYLEPPAPRMIAIGGASGTGKTTVARALAPLVGPAPGAVVIRSDVTRKRLMGVAETEKLPQSAYTPEVSDRVFATMAGLAVEVLAARHAVIMDAVYGDPRLREEIAAVAREAGRPFDGVWLQAAQPILEERISGRRGDASDATVEVLRGQIAKLQPPLDWTTIEAGRPVDAIAAEIVSRLGTAKA